MEGIKLKATIYGTRLSHDQKQDEDNVIKSNENNAYQCNAIKSF
jgi:hypothetical protein